MSSAAVEAQGTTIAIGTDTTPAWLTIGEFKSWSGPGGSAAVIDVSDLSSTRKEKRMGLPDEGQFQININYISDSPGHVALMAARAARTEEEFQVTYSDNSTETFSGFVTGFSRSGQVDGVVEGQVTIEITGEVVAG